MYRRPFRRARHGEALPSNPPHEHVIRADLGVPSTVSDDSSDSTRGVDPRALDGLQRRTLFGLELVDAPDLNLVADALLEHGNRCQGTDLDPNVVPAVVTPNVDILVDLDSAPDSPAASFFRRAHYVLPDGMPIVATSRWLGMPLRSRLTGSGLFEILWPRLVAENRRVVVLCANKEIADLLGDENPRARFVVPPMVEAGNDEQMAHVASDLFDAATLMSAEYVLLGLGHPKDALLMDRLNGLWRESGSHEAVTLGLGASFAMYVGQKRRAPVWMQRIGMEWFFRFLQEPRRLFRRYFIADVAFLGLVRRERRRLAPPRGDAQ